MNTKHMKLTFGDFFILNNTAMYIIAINIFLLQLNNPHIYYVQTSFAVQHYHDPKCPPLIKPTNSVDIRVNYIAPLHFPSLNIILFQTST